MTLDDAHCLTIAINAVIKNNDQREALVTELTWQFSDIHWRVEEDGIEAS